MKKNLVISMTDYILEMDWLTTVEFCDKYNIPKPYFTGDVNSSVDLILQIDAIKHKKFVEYAKFLRKDLKPDMFIGDRAIFDGFVQSNSVIPDYKILSFKESTITFNDKSEFWLINKKNSYKNKNLKKIEDLVGLEIEFNNKCFYI